MSTQDPWQILAHGLLIDTFEERDGDTSFYYDVVRPAWTTLDLTLDGVTLQQREKARAVFEEETRRRIDALLYRPTAEQYKAALLTAWHEALDQVKAAAAGEAGRV